MQQLILFLYRLFRFAIDGVPLPDDAREIISRPGAAQFLFDLSAAHDLSHLVADALERAALSDALDPALADKFRRDKLRAVWRCEQIIYEQDCVARVFSEAGIPFIPLKGTVTRRFWPEPWMRTCHDIDIMVKPCDIERAVLLLEDKLAYRKEILTSHDVSLVSPRRFMVEVHHSMLYKSRGSAASDVLDRIWDHASPTGSGTEFELDSAMFQFLHIAHMVEHVEGGGCGIRPFIDLYLFRRALPLGEDADELLSRGALKKFAAASVKLADHIMRDVPLDEESRAFESFIVNGGVYGNLENQVAIGVTKEKNDKGGRLRYISRRLFLPYETLSNIYPVLKKHKWLAPAMQARRWCERVAEKGVGRYVSELRLSRRVSDSTRSAARSLRDYLGL